MFTAKIAFCYFAWIATTCLSQPPAGRITLYHYTDDAGVNGIRNSGYILPAGPPHNHYGTYVYLTALDPFSHTHAQIAENNMNNPRFTRKTRYVFQVTVGAHQVNKVAHTNPPGRDIYIYTAATNLVLSQTFQWRVFDWRGQTPVPMNGRRKRSINEHVQNGMVSGTFLNRLLQFNEGRNSYSELRNRI